MAIRLLYFASLREALGLGGEDWPLPADVATAGELRDRLAARGGEWTRLVATRNLKCAVNQQLVGFDAPVADGDEVAFFPPVTGG